MFVIVRHGLELIHFVFNKERDRTIRKSKTKALISFAVTASKIGQGHHRVMIYINIVVLEATMLLAKFC